MPDLRTAALEIATQLPKGDPTRRKILAALSQKAAAVLENFDPIGRSEDRLHPMGRVALDKESGNRLDGVRGHTLMPGNVKSKIPKLYSQEDVEDPMAWVKYFSPYSNAVWYVTEFDGSDTMFGWAQLFPGGGELGYISLRELEGLHKGGLPLVERDLYWKPRPLSKAKRS